MRRAAAAALLGLVATGCGGGEDGDRLTVFAAASLTEVLGELEPAFEEEHDVDVRFSFAGSADLAEQIRAGAPADVFVSADVATMERVADLVEPSAVVATNTLTLVTPPGNPGDVAGLDDLAEADLVVCAPEVPCGAAARTLADRAGIPLDPVSEEQSVTDVLGKVAAGEAEVGLVYVTDVRRAAEPVEQIDIPEAGAVVSSYPAAVVRDTDRPDDAAAFVDLLRGEEGRRALAEHGFGRP